MPRKRLFIGQRFRGIPVETINSLAADLDRLEQGVGQPLGGNDGNAAYSFLPTLIKNNTGQALIERSIVGIDTSAFTPPEIVTGSPDQNEADEAILGDLPVEVVAPDATTHANKWAVTLGPIEAGGTGWAVVTGLVWLRVNLTNAAHKFVKPATGDTVYAASAASGAPIWALATGEVEKQWALVLLGGGGSENYRLIRGQSVGIQSGATILIDNVIVLAGGIDPSDANPATQVRIANIFSQTYADNELIDAAYSPAVVASPLTDWETLKTSTGTETYRGISAIVYTFRPPTATRCMSAASCPWPAGSIRPVPTSTLT